MDNKIAVLMPAYNVEKYISRAIQSIRGQTFRNWNLIIVNDGSTDGTFDVIRSMTNADPRIIYISYASNRGITEALNKGLNYISVLKDVTHIARMDADDISHIHRFEEQLRFMKNYPKYDVCGSNILIKFKNGYRMKSYPKFVTEYEFLEECPLAHGTMLAKREVFNKLRYNTTFYAGICEDYDLWGRVLLGGFEIGNCQEILYTKIERESSNVALMSRERINAWNNIVRAEYFGRKHINETTNSN